MIFKEMSESLTPWDDNEPHPLAQKRHGLTARRKVIPRYNSDGEKARAASQGRGRGLPRDVIKLQERVPTEMVTISDWQVELKPLGFLKSELVIKIPNQFVTLPPKRTTDSSRKSSRSISKLTVNGMIRQRVSFKNFQREIEELDRLRTSNKIANIDLTTRPKSKGLFKISQPYSAVPKPSRNCSTKNMHPFSDPPTTSPPKLRLHQQPSKKKHILDSLLSKFQ